MSIEKNKFNSLFRNVIPNSISGIKIYNQNEKYIKNQNYDDVTNLENRIWSELYQKLEFLLDQFNISFNRKCNGMDSAPCRWVFR